MIFILLMNEYPTLPRLQAGLVETALMSSPVVVLTGARQTGKSTLVKRLTGPYTYVTLDDVDTEERAKAEPDALIRSSPSLIVDEVQRAPGLLQSIKRAVDEDRTPGRFVLTGSADLLLMKRIPESLAGRAVHLTLWPFTRRERHGAGAAGAWTTLLDAADADWGDVLRAEDSPREDWRQAVLLGGYPTPSYHLGDPDARNLWHTGYTRTYLERDLRDLANVASLVDVRRLMRASCLRLGNLVNQTELARDVGLSQPTVHRHLSLLEVSYQLVRVPAFAVNRTKRLIKTPKLYWSDTALAMHLAGEETPRGAHLENLVLCDLMAWRGSLLDAPNVLYWRTTTGIEVDFVVEWRDQLLPIEVKSGRRIRLRDARGLTAFREEYGDHARTGLLLYDGDEITWLADGVLAAPWWSVI